jgi:PBSX family phage terminase large subunit
MQVAPLTGKAKQAVTLADARYNIWDGSVRSGKTVSSLLAWLRFVRAAPPGNLAMVGKTERTLKRNVIDTLVEWLGERRCKYLVGSGELILLGRRIYVAGANNEASVAKIQGLTLLGAYGDEITTWPESFWSMLGTRLSQAGARFFGTCNPDSPGHWLKRDYLDRARLWLNGAGELVEGDSALDLARFSFRLEDNRANLPAGYIEGLEAQYVGLWRKRYIDGDWAIAEGAIYDMFDPARHVVDILPPIRRWVSLGVDYGTKNPFAGLLLGLGDETVNGRPKSTLYVAGEWRYDSRAANRQLSDAEYSERLRGWLDAFEHPHGGGAKGVRPEWTVVDPSAASFVTQLHRDGLTPTLADNSVLDGIRTVSSLLAGDRLKVHRSCTGLIDELPGYAWDDDAAVKKGEDKPIKLNDHSCDALRYATHTTQAVWHGLLAA